MKKEFIILFIGLITLGVVSGILYEFAFKVHAGVFLLIWFFNLLSGLFIEDNLKEGVIQGSIMTILCMLLLEVPYWIANYFFV